MDFNEIYRIGLITAVQIAEVYVIEGMRITSEQYTAWQSTLSSKFSEANIYVDDEYITIS